MPSAHAPSAHASPPRPHPLARLWRYAGRRRPRLVAATSLSVVNKLFDLAPPFLIGVAVDVVSVGETSLLARWTGVQDAGSQLWILALLTLLVWGLESATDYLNEVQWRTLAQDLQHDLRTDGYAHVQGLDLAWFEDRSTGGLMSILNDDVNQLERFLDVGANDILQLLATVLALGAYFFAVAPQVAWVAFLPIPVIALGSLRFQTRIAPRYERVRGEVEAINAQLSNNLSGIATIKSFTAEDAENERMRGSSHRYRAANRRAIVLSAAFVPVIRMAIATGFIATLVAGGRLALDGAISVGTFSVLVFMTQRLLWPLTRLGQTLDLYQRGMASTRRILDLLDVEPMLRDGDRPLPAGGRGGASGEVRFEGVEFRYGGDAAPGEPAVRGLDLTFPAGRQSAIVGATGAGKSTIVKLLLRFYDPTRGRILLDGTDLRDLRLKELRGAIGLVSQDVFLFHGTVRDNLLYGDPDASDDDLWRALADAEAEAFVRAMPAGLDTVVGERGQKLSGGQRQRLSLARALLKAPPVLVLDEATSAVDNETEAAIQRSLERAARGRTTIAIAHRLSTIRHADAIFVMEDGRVAESGTHEELLARGGAYARLWGVQTGEREAALAGRSRT